VLALCVSYTFAGYALSSANVTITADTADFQYRALYVQPDILGLSGYIAIAAGVDANSGGGTANVDVVAGGLVFNVLNYPTAALGAFNAQAKLTFDIAAGSVNATYDASGAFVVASYLSIIERDPTNVDVRTVNLKGLSWANTYTWNGDLLVYTCKASNFIIGPIKSGENIQFDFLVARSLGAVNAASTTIPVSPRTFESLLTIDGWQYASPNNRLILKVGTVAGAGNAQASGSLTASGSGDRQIYVAFAEKAEVNGALHSVTVKKSAVADLTLVSSVDTWVANVKAVYGAQVTGSIFEIDTQAPGAAKVVYDPTMGNGPILEKSGAAQLFVGVIIALVMLLA